jgi:proline iminopeptidase
LGALAIEYGRRNPSSVSHVIAVGTPPRGAMAWLLAEGRAFFERDASDERKRILRENLARLGPAASPRESVLAQTPMRFFDPTFDPAGLFAEADADTALLRHIMANLTYTWDIRIGAESLRVPMLLALGRCDYVVPHVLWDGIASGLPAATTHLFARSGHQPFFEEPERFVEVVLGWMAGQAQ